jgi:hypothetical protein
MKNVLLALVLSISLNTFAQIENLESLSTGSFVNFSPLINMEEQLFGYLAIYNKGEADDNFLKFEYVYMDKNLNKVANKDFFAENSVGSYNSFVNKKGEIELDPEINYYKYYNIWTGGYNDFVLPKSKIIQIATNTISNKEEICYENKTFVNCIENQTYKEYNQGVKKEKRENGFIYESDVTIMNDGTYLLYEYIIEKKKQKNNSLIKFDANKKEVWRYEFNRGFEKKDVQYINVLNFDDYFIYLLEFTELGDNKTAKMLKIDLKTGNKQIELPVKGYNFESLYSLRKIVETRFSITNKKEFDDKIVMIGELCQDKTYKRYGFYRVIFDKKTNQVAFNFFSFDEIKTDFKLGNYGETEKGYSLMLRDLYVFNNTSVGFLFEKYKIGDTFFGNGAPKTSDLVYFNADKDFKIASVKVLSKEKSNDFASDYLFSQYINQGNDVAFFYRDYQKSSIAGTEKNWQLFINTIKNGVFSQEQIPMSSKENFIYPYIAKEGYILLREFNKEAKYNGIRLERLNY